MKNTLIRLFSVSSLILAGSAIAADDSGRSTSLIETPRTAERSEMSPHIGIFVGAANHNGEGYNPGASFMVDAGFQPVVPFSLAIQTQYEPATIDAPGADIDFNTLNILAKATLNFGGTNAFFRHSYIGAKGGISTYSGDVATETNPAIGGTLGFDIPLADARGVSLGAEATYLGVLGTDVETPDQASLLGAMKYWF